MNKKQFGWTAAGLLTVIIGLEVALYNKEKSTPPIIKARPLFSEVDSSKTKVDSSFNDLENTLDYFHESMMAGLDSSFNDLTKLLDDRKDKLEFPHVENFTVLAKNLGIPKSELRDLQRYFKAYNEHVAQNISKYSTNL